MKTWIFFEEGKEDSPEFEIKARNHLEAFNKAYQSYGPQVEGLLCVEKPKRVDMLIEALESITYKDSNGVIRAGIYGDEEVPDIVYKALNKQKNNE